MRPLCALVSLLLGYSLSFNAQAQVGIGITTPDQSAQLEVKSANKGLLVPRVTSTGDVSNPAKGLLIYQSSATEGFYYNSGTPQAPAWLKLTTTTLPSGTAGGDLTGSYPSPTIAPGAVTLSKINTAGAGVWQVPTFNGGSVVWATPSGNTLSFSFATKTILGSLLSGNVPLPDSHLQDGILVDGTNTIFTVTKSGIYRIAYTIIPNPGYLQLQNPPSLGTRLTINGSPIVEGVLPVVPILPLYTTEVLVNLGVNSTISLQLVNGASIQSASMSIQQLR